MFNVGDVALLVYPEGDADRVTIIALFGDEAAIVADPQGVLVVTLQEFLVDITSDDDGRAWIDIGGEA